MAGEIEGGRGVVGCYALDWFGVIRSLDGMQCSCRLRWEVSFCPR